jgi:pilus assembly protein Flp/PilA
MVSWKLNLNIITLPSFSSLARATYLDGLCRQSLKSLKEFLTRGIYKKMVSFLKKEDGPTTVEYAVMLSLIIVVCIAAITTLGSNANQAFSFVGSNIKG